MLSRPRLVAGAFATMQASVDGPTPAAITIAWLVRLRWGAALGQTLTIAIASRGLGLDLPLVPLAALVAVTLVSNAVLALRVRRSEDVSTRLVGIVLAGDIFVLSGLLYFSGGPSNPFSVMYLVHVTLAALVLGVRWAGGMVALSGVLYAMLFIWHVPVPELSHVHHQPGSPFSSRFSVHLQGMWIAFALAAGLIAYFVSRVAEALRARESELARVRTSAARSEKLASLTTLAAGAAHELGTPLGTIAVAAKELERTIRAEPDDALQDARLIRTEVERCRGIIQRMSAQAGETIGELPRPTTAAEVFRGCLDRLAKDARVVVENDEAPAFTCPSEGAIQVVLSLVHNACWATRQHGGRVALRATATPRSVALVVTDDGVGIDDDVLGRIGEPFVTTKRPGEGMGLGIFLARTFAERWGGRFELRSEEGKGTVATLELPRAEAARA
jgi:two-component system sensor histidine kinase RegB